MCIAPTGRQRERKPKQSAPTGAPDREAHDHRRRAAAAGANTTGPQPTARSALDARLFFPRSPPQASPHPTRARMPARAEVTMSTSQINELLRRDYPAGWVTDIEQESAPPGLSEDTVRFISAKK